MTETAYDIAASKPAESPDALLQLRGHPHFPQAMRASATGMIALSRRNRLTGWLLSDRALAVLGQAVIYLHLARRADDPQSGLTPGRFRAFCQENRLCSPGRAGAILAFMRLTGHIETAPGPADRRITRLRPSEKLMEIARNRLRSQFTAIAMLRPEIAPAVERLGAPDFEAAFYREFGGWFSGGGRVLDLAPGLRLFAERDAGMLILFRLMLSGDADDLPVPSRPVPVSIAALAREFRVSRTHVLRLIRDAERAKLVARNGAKGETISLSPSLGDDLLNMHAGLFDVLARSALAGLEARP